MSEKRTTNVSEKFLLTFDEAASYRILVKRVLLEKYLLDAETI